MTEKKIIMYANQNVYIKSYGKENMLNWWKNFAL